MTLPEIRTEIEQYFSTEWSAVNPSIPVGYENIAFTPPDEEPWLKLFIVPATKNRIGVEECYEDIGLVSIQVYTPLQEGMQVSDKLVADVNEIFISAQLRVNFRDINFASVGEQDGRWMLVNVFIEYAAT